MAGKRLPRKPNLLVVDDKSANLLALQATLSHEYTVIPALSGWDAINLLTEEPSRVDLILMDVQMPVMDGFEAASRIKKLPGCEDTPIIFITAIYSEDPYIRKGYRAGGIDYVTKPFDPEILKMKLAVYASFKLHEEAMKAREKSIGELEKVLGVGRRLSALLEGLPIGALITDVECQIQHRTDQVGGILGPGASALDGGILGWWDASGRLKDQNGPLARAIHHGESSRSELMRIRCADGASRTILVSISPLRNVDGLIVGGVVLVQDLTESKEIISEELERRVARLMSPDLELEES
jgi:PAS domain S-box-containing protein